MTYVTIYVFILLNMYTMYMSYYRFIYACIVYILY